MRRIREERGWQQEILARHACADLGVDWTRETVLRIEQGRRKLTLGETVGLCFVFGVPLQELLQGEGIALVVPEGLRMPLAAMGELLESGTRPSGAETPQDRRLSPLLRQNPPRPPDLAEQRAAKAIGTDVAVIRLVARQLWGRSLSEERDKRAGKNANRMHKSHVTRELYMELQSALAQLR
jgi:transcriptional regulator with XRE-family HTH domain